MLKPTIYTVKMTFTEPLLGTAPLATDLYTRFVADKKAKFYGEGNGVTPDELAEELESLQPEDGVYEEKDITVFRKLEDGTPFIYDYHIKGMFKDSCGMLTRVPGSESKKLRAFKKVIDGLVFVYPRRIALKLPAGSGLTVLERPLRARTPQGERCALKQSEQAPAGTTCNFDIEVLGDVVTPALVKEWLWYGQKRGCGQWRNSGMGRFSYELASTGSNGAG